MYLWLYEDQVNEQHDEIMFDVFVREAFAVGALCEAYAFAEGAVVGFGICGVQHGNGVAAGDAYWHFRGVTWRGRSSLVSGREEVEGEWG
jgi:hypothetical protein